MFKYVIVICALIACVAGKPGHLLSAQLLAAPAPLLAAPAPVVTATSSQLIARNFNGIAAAPVIASVPVAAPVPVVKTVAPVATRIISPFAAPLIAKYADAAPLHYTTPLGYATAPQPIYF
ncbi:calphotin-like [Drosophila madeirensis]